MKKIKVKNNITAKVSLTKKEVYYLYRKIVDYDDISGNSYSCDIDEDVFRNMIKELAEEVMKHDIEA